MPPPRAQDPLRAGSGRPRALFRDPNTRLNAVLPHPLHSFMAALPGAHRKTDLADVLVLIPQPFHDDRGLFTRTFDADIFDDYLGRPGISASFVQDSQSRSAKGVIRGMHGRSGRGEAKLVRCANGAVHDVLVDIREDSPTFGKQQAFLLDDNDFWHLYVPPGFLHGFQALTATADVCYRIDRPHDPSEDLGSHTTTQILRSIGHCRSRWSPPATRGGSWAALLTHLA